MAEDNFTQAKPAPGRVIAAFAAVYVIWGSTYLGIRFAIETMPPFMMGGARFLLAGGTLYGWLRWRGAPAPDPAHWQNAVLVGALLIAVGNGAVNWAAERIPSGLIALIIAVTPLWFALMDWLRPGGLRPKLQTLVGLVIGFLGMALLVRPQEGLAKDDLDPARLAAVIIASMAWAAGSLYARYTPKPETPMMAGALQMIAGGVILTFVGIVAGEAELFSFWRVSQRSMAAFLYLTLIGSLVGFTAYSWLLKVSSPAKVSTHAYVNPVIALILGWALAGERLTSHALWAAAIIIAGVVIISTQSFSVLRRNSR